MQHSENPSVIQQEVSKTEKKQWITPQVDSFSKSNVQSGALALVEGLSVLGDLTS